MARGILAVRFQLQKGFTIVELLVVIVVIAILAAVTLVSYNGISSRSQEAAIKTNLATATQRIEAENASEGVYPTSLSAVGISTSDGSFYIYQQNATSYCLSLTKGVVSFKSNSSDTSPQSGSCTGVFANGTSCPAGYIVVPGNASFGTSDFCSMKYEAKNNGSGNAVSLAAGTPWTNISQTDAISAASSACTSCHLITEAEWMTVAANVLSVPGNWTSGTVGSGLIFRGHSDGNPAGVIEAGVDDANGYANTGNSTSSGPAQRRTLTLTNGEVIWDLSGNAWEWTNATITGNQPGLSSGDAGSWKEWNASTLLMNSLPTVSRPSTISSTVGGYSASQGIGRLWSNPGEGGARSYVRGGSWDGGAIAGVLTLNLNNVSNYLNTGFGFRVTR